MKKPFTKLAMTAVIGIILTKSVQYFLRKKKERKEEASSEWTGARQQDLGVG